MKNLLTKLAYKLPGSMPLKSKKQTALLIMAFAAIMAADAIIKVCARIPQQSDAMALVLEDTTAQSRWQALNDAYRLSQSMAGSTGESDTRRDSRRSGYSSGSQSADKQKPKRRESADGQKSGRQSAERQKQWRESAETQYFMFDPNTATEENLVALGLSRQKAKQFVEYRQKGKKFYVPADITDSWAIDHNTYSRLREYIRINTDSITMQGKIRDLNTIDRQGLVECGLSEAEADKVLEFREKVGYYYAPWQIGDCLGQKRGNKLKNRFYVCRSVERRIMDLGTAGPGEMAACPYISEEQARMIVELRKTQKPTKSSLAEAGIFGNDEMKRLANYIKE